MAERQNRESGSGILESDAETGIDNKRAKIQFNRATIADTDAAFGSASSPRKQRGIPKEKRTEVSINDSRAEVSGKVKGKAPTLPVEEETPTRRVGRPPKRLKPTIEDSNNTAKFLLSAIEMGAVLSVGPTGEMTEFERGLMQAPLQRIIARTPISVVEKGGIIVDCGFLIIGGGIYFSRVFKGAKLPDFSKKKKGEEVVQDPQAPVSGRPEMIVDTIKPGDKDGLAVPIPSAITMNMNGAI